MAAALAAPVAGATAPEMVQASPEVSSVIFHVAGYADATYIDAQGEAGSTAVMTVAPIFHMQIGEHFLFEAEMEGEADDRGGQESALEYATVNWLLTDSAALVVGKFLSPACYYFQNLHPSWINKLAAAPAGFGHGGAAPLTDVGLQLRGGRALGDGQINYAVYVANGPRLGLEGMEGLDLNVEGSRTNRDGERVWGGRVGWLPTARLEVGASVARGDVVLDSGAMDTMAEPSRRYQVDGVDVAWQPRPALEFRGEWIRQRVGDAAMSSAPDGATWRGWYLQGAYRFSANRWEAVVRVGDSLSPHGESTFEQTALGLNFLVGPRTRFKINWELNGSQNAEVAADRVLFQFAHGF